MLLRVPSADVLTLAMAAGAVPAGMAAAEVKYAKDAEGALWISPRGRFSAALARSLSEFGIEAARTGVLPEGDLRSASCWAEVLPLTPSPLDATSVREHPILFELTRPDRFPALVLEMFRLGSDRITVRHLADSAGGRWLIRVIGPPFYTLLRAIDRDDAGDDGGRMTAYSERAPGVWIECGYRHPLEDRLTPPESHLTLVRSSGEWSSLPEAEFDDVFRVLRFECPSSPVTLGDRPLDNLLSVRLRLVAMSDDEPARMWILRGEAIDVLEEFVATSDEELLSKLSFAVVGENADSCALLRARPGLKEPPVLVHDALALRPYAQLPHLFVPCGRRLDPPLRRDTVRRLLGDDGRIVTWLVPAGEDSFRTCHVPEDAFRPLTDWVAYVLDRDRHPLEAWMQSFRFEFDEFLTQESPSDERNTARANDSPIENAAKSALAPSQSQSTPQTWEAEPVTGTATATVASEPHQPLPGTRPDCETGDRRDRLLAIQQQVLDRKPFDGSDDSVRWIEMAELHQSLGEPAEAADCWLHAIWERDSPPPEWTQRVAALRPAGGFTESRESAMPVRAAWLGWLAVAQRSRDPLTLARARDRLLERLHERGLNAQVDLPAFLRLAQSESDESGQDECDALRRLHESVVRWVERETAAVETPATLRAAPTTAYLDLAFAWGFARRGATADSRRLTDKALSILAQRDVVHAWLARAFEVRIASARDSTNAPLPDELLRQLDEPPLRDARIGASPARYLIDRLRRQSRILEPFEQVDAYSRSRTTDDDVARGVERLCDVADRGVLEERIRAYLTRAAAPQGERSRARIARAALELAPRLGERFAVEAIGHADAWMPAVDSTIERAALAGRALFVAAHFGRSPDAARLTGLLVDSVRRSTGSVLNPADADRLADILRLSLRGLTRLGLVESSQALLSDLEQCLAPDNAMSNSSGSEHFPRPGSSGIRAVLRLPIAQGWLLSGDDSRAMPILQEAESLLRENGGLVGTTGAMHPAAALAVARGLIAVLGALNASESVPRLVTLLKDLRGVHVPTQADTHYSASWLAIAESMVLAAVPSDPALDPATRRRLLDSEHRVRERIHRDMRRMLDECGEL